MKKEKEDTWLEDWNKVINPEEETKEDKLRIKLKQNKIVARQLQIVFLTNIEKEGSLAYNILSKEYSDLAREYRELEDGCSRSK